MDSTTDDGLFRLIDIYCERTDFTFWSEPANAVTNLFLFLAGVLGLLLVKHVRSSTHRGWLIVLSVNAMLIGIGSFLFHTLANGWSLLADVIPISIFMVLFLIWGLRHLIQLNAWAVSAWVALFLLAGPVLEAALPKGFLNGSGSYLHALAAMAIIGHLIRNSHQQVARLFLLAMGVFALSLTFRSIDMLICPGFPLGTHFLWHTLNGCLLYICLRIIAKTDAHRSQP